MHCPISMISSPISRDLAGALSALREDYQPKRVTFADLALEGNKPGPFSPTQSLSSFITAPPFFPRDHRALYSHIDGPTDPFRNQTGPSQQDLSPASGTGTSQWVAASEREAELSGLLRKLSEERRQRDAVLEELESLRTENLSLRAVKDATDKEIETVRTEREELRRALEETEQRQGAALERAVTSEKSILSFIRDKAAESLSAELLELERLVKWTELNPNTSVHAQQLRTHAESVRELRQRVTEQYQSQLLQIEKGIPLARLSRVCSEVPPRPLPVPDPVLYIPTDVECALPYVSTEPAATGFAQPRYGPQMVLAVLPKQEDVQTRLIRKLSNWHPELTDTQLFGHIIAAQQAAPGQSFSGMSMSEIISCVHQLIVTCRNN